MLPLSVLEDVAANLTNYKGCGESVLEMSHRSAVFKEIIEDAEKNLRDIMNIPDNYKVLFVQGGGTLHFAMVAMNLLRNSGKADYIVTGTWAKKAAKEAMKFGDIKITASSEEDTFTYIPKVAKEDFREDADYVHITMNNTIYGTRFNYIPDTGDIPLVADMSSNILSEEFDVSKFGLIYAGVQKNVGPAGMVVVIIREDLIREDLDPKTPVYLSYKTHDDAGSMYNTPNCWAIYCCGKVFKYLKNLGGLEAMNKINEDKAAVLYDFLDSSKLFKGTVDREVRSLMNVPFVTGSKELDAEVVAYTKAAGFDNLKGHKSVGGLRASIYNAMPKEGIVALVECLKKFEAEHT